MEADIPYTLTRSIRRTLISPYPCQNLLFFFLMIFILTRLRRNLNLNVVLIYTFLMNEDVDIFHVFVGHLYFFFFSFFISFFVLVVWDRFSLCSSDCSETHPVDQTGLKLTDLAASASWVLWLKACATVTWPSFWFLFCFILRHLTNLPTMASNSLWRAGLLWMCNPPASTSTNKALNWIV